MSPARAVKARPAETAGGFGAAATVVAFALGANEAQLAAVGAVAGLLPAAVSLLVDNGGVVGVVRLLVRGRRG